MTTESFDSTLRRQAGTLAARVSAQQFATNPTLASRYGAAGQAKCTEDAAYHLRHLASAVGLGRPALFVSYIAWLRSLLDELGIGSDDLFDQLAATRSELHETFGADAAAACDILDAVMADPPAAVAGTTPYLTDTTEAGRLAQQYLAKVLGNDRAGAIALIQSATDAGMPLETLYLEVFQPCLREVGRLWQTGRISVAQEHLVTAATQVAMAQLYPRVFAAPRNGYTAVIVAVGGELHEVGARMVADVLELRGWNTIFVGANTPIAALVALAESEQPDVIALSSTIGAHIPDVAAAITAVRAVSKAPILVGGRAFLEVPELWRDVGADGTAPDAVTAVELADQLAHAA